MSTTWHDERKWHDGASKGPDLPARIVVDNRGIHRFGYSLRPRRSMKRNGAVPSMTRENDTHSLKRLNTRSKRQYRSQSGCCSQGICAGVAEHQLLA